MTPSFHFLLTTLSSTAQAGRLAEAQNLFRDDDPDDIYYIDERGEILQSSEPQPFTLVFVQAHHQSIAHDMTTYVSSTTADGATPQERLVRRGRRITRRLQ